MKAMTVIIAVQIFMLLWNFASVCQADADGCSLRCNDVNETVGNEVIFACSIPEQFTKDCVTLSKFQYPKKNKKSEINMCKHELPDGTCEKRSIFTCRYTPDNAMEETFKFYVQTRSGTESKGFTVNITEAVNSPTPKIEALRNNGTEPQDFEAPKHEKAPVFAISAGVGCFIIILILTIIIIYKKHPGEFQKRKKFQAVKQNDDDNNKTEHV